MSRIAVMMIVGLGLFATTARADDTATRPGVAFPGSFWISAGDVGPAEPGNTIGQSAFEQGITVWSKDAWFLVPYVSVGYTADSLNYDWNNKHPSTVGVKLARRVPGGVVQGGGGVLFERDPATGKERHGTAFVSYWSGWKLDRGGHGGRRIPGYPGSLYVTSGLLTGRDPENWLTVVSAQQGIVVHKWGGLAAVPFAATAASFDTKNRDWENRMSYDAGVKLVQHLTGGVVEAGVAQRRQHQFRTGRVASAPVLFVNFWIGWNPTTFAKE